MLGADTREYQLRRGKHRVLFAGIPEVVVVWCFDGGGGLKGERTFYKSLMKEGEERVGREQLSEEIKS